MCKMNNPEINPNDTTTNIDPKFSQDKWSDIEVSGIYGLRNKTTGKWYVGYSKNISVRWLKYKKHSCRGQIKLFAALKKYGYDGFEKVILEKCSTEPEIWVPRERHWIQHFNCITDGYNLTPGGDGPGKVNLGKKRTPQACKNIGNSSRGRIHSDESKRLCSDKMKTKLASMSQVDLKLRTAAAVNATRNKPKSESHKEKLRLASLEYWKIRKAGDNL